MSALLFIVGFAALLGVAQLFGWTHDSRDSADWHSPERASRPDHAAPVTPIADRVHTGTARLDTHPHQHAA